MADQTPKQNSSLNEEITERLAHALHGMSYGSIEVTVHDGRVVQIERRDKTRVKIPLDAGETSRPDKEGI